MISSSKAEWSSFDASVRVFSLLSLASATGVLLVGFLPPERGIQFGTHIALFLAFVAQLAMLLLLSVIALVLRIRRQLRWTRFSVVLAVLAVLGLVGQFYALHTVAVDGSSVP